MQKDPYDIFTRAHRVYIKGMRAGLAECLKSAYGSDWWESGVLPAVGENQRENLERDRQKVAPNDRAQLLDTSHFARIVERNHAAAFANQFSNIDYTLRLFSHLSIKRNEWAHVLDDQWTVPNTMQLVQAMREILISLRRREALEIQHMFQDSLDQQVSVPEEELNVEADPTPEPSDEDYPLTADGALLGFWRTLESYLEIESVVLPASDKEQERGLVRFVVKVTNTAPSSEGRPDITFRNVRLELTGARALTRSNYSSAEWNNLGPGQTKTAEFSAAAKGLAAIEFHVTGNVDQDKLLRVRHRGILPEEVVIPLLEQFSSNFEGVGIDEALTEIVEAATRIQPDMPFAEVSALRIDLGQFKQLVTQKREALNALFKEYHLDRESRLGAPFVEMIRLLMQLEQQKIDEMDTAISQTDMESIRSVALDFEQLQIAVLRGRDTIRQRMGVRQS